MDATDVSQKKIVIGISQKTANTLTISVRDFGKGIAENDRDKMLSPFYTTKADGMGIGLSISRSIMEAHRGALSFNEEMTNGSEFIITLPLSPGS